ncbi:alpha/beta hydrolase [Streptomyces oceani]|uniref:alpha/beta hydrolase n=1 Tax=Streptomyces oceani TaxID=1075402 RepID=UPI001FCDD3B8|nr:alpha/beta-hydrolase family protein [Streptomyces oceani]
MRRPYLTPADPSYVVRRWPDLTALCVATVFFWLSLTPSLVPRPWYLQGLIGGITASIGYALGALTGALVRAALRSALVRARLRGAPLSLPRGLPRLFRRLLRRATTAQAGANPRPRPYDTDRARAHVWQIYFLLSPLLTVYCLSESARMQRDLRRLQELPASLTWHAMMITLMAGALCALLLLLARGIRLGTRALIRVLGRFVPRPVAVVAGLLVSATLVTVGSRDVVFDRGVVGIVSRIAAATDQSTKDGVTQSGSRYVSGSPDSLVAWDDLGYEGRNFTGSTLSRKQIAQVTGRPARPPVRVYVGQRAAETYAARARLAVAELERTGGFRREVLAVAGTTGRGWINSTDAEPLEYMYGGDTAIVAMQYSYLPSWLSFLLDKEQAGKANRALLEAVRDRLREMPEKERPKLVVFGESLGAYGVEAAFEDPEDLLASVDGAVFAGSPHASPIRREVTEDRDAGSPVWRPEYRDGRHFRFAQYPEADLARPEGRWESPRVVFLQNASDPIVWWSPDLAVNPPRWLRAPLGPDITTEVNWAPFVTFWQTTVDMAVSYSVSAPHGHRYGTASVAAWAAVLPPDDWSDEDTERLQEFMDKRDAPY